MSESDSAPSEKPVEPTPPAPEKSEPSTPLIGIDHFAEVDLRLGKVVEASDHPDADRLLVMQVDIGEEKPRQIVAGIRKDYEPEELVGRTLVIVANLKPAKLRGQESHGMMLAVKGDEKVIPLGIDGPAKVGTRVT